MRPPQSGFVQVGIQVLISKTKSDANESRSRVVGCFEFIGCVLLPPQPPAITFLFAKKTYGLESVSEHGSNDCATNEYCSYASHGGLQVPAR
jgi:hypothetical protein